MLFNNKLVWCGLLLVGMHSKVVWIETEQESGSLSVQPFFEFKTESEKSKFMAGDFSFYTQTCRSVADERYVN